MAASIAGSLWQAVRLIRECRRGALPGVCSSPSQETSYRSHWTISELNDIQTALGRVSGAMQTKKSKDARSYAPPNTSSQGVTGARGRRSTRVLATRGTPSPGARRRRRARRVGSAGLKRPRPCRRPSSPRRRPRPRAWPPRASRSRRGRGRPRPPGAAGAGSP